MHPRDGREFEGLVRYMMRPPVSLSRLHFTPGSHEVVYVPKGGYDDIEPTQGETIDAMEFVARVLVQIPDRAALRRRWAEMIRQVYEVAPLVCPRCRGEMCVIGFITQPAVIKRILDHLRKHEKVARPPPHLPQPTASPA